MACGSLLPCFVPVWRLDYCGCVTIAGAVPSLNDCDSPRCQERSISNFSGSRLSLKEGSLFGTQLKDVNLRFANLSGSDLVWTNMEEVDLSNSNCVGTLFDRSNFEGCDLSHANLTSASFEWAMLIKCNLSAANLTGTKFKGCIYDRDTQWPRGFAPLAYGATLVQNQRESAH